MKPAHTLLVAFTTFLLGLVAGLLWRGPESRRDEARGDHAPPGLPDTVVGSAVSDVSHASGNASKESGGTRSLSLSDLTTVLKAQLAAGLSTDGTLREPFCAALGLTAEEKSEVEQAIADTRRELRALEEKNVRIISQTDEVAECDVARFPEEGARLEAAFESPWVTRWGRSELKPSSSWEGSDWPSLCPTSDNSRGGSSHGTGRIPSIRLKRVTGSVKDGLIPTFRSFLFPRGAVSVRMFRRS